MANLAKISGRWVNLDKPGGLVLFVGGGTSAYQGKGASDSNSGLHPEEPMSTISNALAKVVTGRGDTVVILPGTVTLTAGLTIDEDDVTLCGVEGVGSVNPSAIANTLAASDDVLDVTGDNVTIEGLHFPASGAALTSRINVGGSGCVIRNNTFLCGANDLETITIPAAGTYCTISGNRFAVTANGPDAAIEIEAAGAAHLSVLNNVFHGGNDTNAWDAGAVNSGAAHTQCLVKGNVSNFGAAIVFTAAATGVIANNFTGEGTLGSMIDPGSCMCFENYEADAIDETARVFPTTAAS